MGKYSKEDYEFERNKQAILALTNKKEVQAQSRRQAVWEYELNEYRRRKKQDRFLFFGACCGVLSFIIAVFSLLNQLYHLIG